MNKQASGMEQGRGLNCRGTGMGRGMGRKQGQRGQVWSGTQGPGPDFVRGRCFEAEESLEPELRRGRRRGRSVGLNCGSGRGQRRSDREIKSEEN